MYSYVISIGTLSLSLERVRLSTLYLSGKLQNTSGGHAYPSFKAEYQPIGSTTPVLQE